MSDSADGALQRTVGRLDVFAHAAFGVGLRLTRDAGGGPPSATAARPVAAWLGGGQLLVVDGDVAAGPLQPLLDEFLDMAAGLLGSLAAREASTLEPMREELWRDLLGAPAIVGTSPDAAALRAALPAAAGSAEPLFIAGEPGSGRRSLAAAVHRVGPRAGGPFVAEQPAATPEPLRFGQLFGDGAGPGLAAMAAGGTLYLAGVEHLPGACQERLLAHLEGRGASGSPPARIVASADVDLDQLVRRGRFRRDLAARLTARRVAIAPLRQRPEDIPLIASHLVRRHAAACGAAPPSLAPDAVDALKRHPWAGNVRELDDALARAGAGRSLIRAEDLPESIAGERRDAEAADGPLLRRAVSELEVGMISRALDDANWNKSRAARHLGLSRLGLQKKIDRYGIDRRR